MAAERDELGWVLMGEKSAMLDRSPRYVHYTLAPGLDCNYHCRYCFENGKRYNVMTPETERAVLDYMLRNIEQNKALKDLGIT